MEKDRDVGRCVRHGFRAPGVVLLAVLGPAVLVGCGGSGSTAAGPTATPSASPRAAAQPPSSDNAAADAATVRQKGYDPSGAVVRTSDGFGHALYAFHGTCHGSADGYCQIMLFFDGSRYAGTDTANASTSILSYRAAGTGSFAVTYPTYKRSDPLCCPSGRPVTVVYHFDGRRLRRES
jgi:hypothetical protein